MNDILREISKTLPTSLEIKRIIRRKKDISSYDLYKTYSSVLNNDDADSLRLLKFLHKCSKLELGKLNALMVFFYYNQKVMYQDQCWDDFTKYLEVNDLIDQVKDDKFKTYLLGIKWIVAYRLALRYLQDEAECLDYDVNWKEYS